MTNDIDIRAAQGPPPGVPATPPIAIGALVRLKSGGPSMTVLEIAGNRADCGWFDGAGSLHNYSFHRDAFVAIPANVTVQATDRAIKNMVAGWGSTDAVPAVLRSTAAPAPGPGTCATCGAPAWQAKGDVCAACDGMATAEVVDGVSAPVVMTPAYAIPQGTAIQQASEAISKAADTPASPVIDLQAERERADTAQQVEDQQHEHQAAQHDVKPPTLEIPF